jgi:MoaA/NifB/PqqE/SkfB family radical SAM enzyme
LFLANIQVEEEKMPQTRAPESGAEAVESYRIDVKLHDVLMDPGKKRSTLVPDGPALNLPEPVFPQRQYSEETDATLTEYQRMNAKRTWKTWGKPYFQSRSLQNRKELRPIIAYLFTEFKCNLSCHYCWAFDNRIKGINEDVARRSIDWLHSIGNRVLALMGGEVLLRPQLVHKITDYAAKKGFFVYVPTNGRLMRPEVVDRLGDAGVAVFNIAIDSIKDRPELPKAFEPIKDYFEYCVKQQRRYGYTIAINTNICRNNMDDVRRLADLALDYNISIDFHINESPMIEQERFNDRIAENSTFLRPEDYSKVDDLLDWIIERHKGGQRIVNPISHLHLMKDLMRGEVQPWACRAGQNMLIIRMDGTLAPCFPMYSATHDWGVVGRHKFDREHLTEMKKECTKHCLSTCNYILAFCYNTRRVLWWATKQAARGFKGVSGSF